MGIENRGISEREIPESESKTDSREHKEDYKKTTITVYEEGGPITVNNEFLSYDVARFLLSRKAVDELNQERRLDIDREEVKWDRGDSPTASLAVYFYDKEGNTLYGIYPQSVDEYLYQEKLAVPILVKINPDRRMDWQDFKPNWEVSRSDQMPDETPARSTDADLELEYNK
jgi:hypothetical protein